MTAVEELALRIRSGNVDPIRGAAILEGFDVGDGVPDFAIGRHFTPLIITDLHDLGAVSGDPHR